VKVFRLPEKVRALIFDMDLTLYTSPEYGRAQNDGLVRMLAGKQGKSFEEMEGELADRRGEWAASHNGAKPSFSNLVMTYYGVTMDENIAWREEICDPSPYIKEDRELRRCLLQLTPAFALSVVTNNPVKTARITLEVLGVGDLFGVITGLDTWRTPKPHRLPFIKTAEALGVGPEHCVSVGDRYDIDVAPPLELGMGGILVDGVEDVYRLGEVLGVKR
jgi:phosphoglycolate phosphatase/putative hydrolase of the HAD superfamily